MKYIGQLHTLLKLEDTVLVWLLIDRINKIYKILFLIILLILSILSKIFEYAIALMKHKISKRYAAKCSNITPAFSHLLQISAAFPFCLHILCNFLRIRAI